MDALATLARTVLFPLHCAYERNEIPRYLRELEASQWLEPAALTALRQQRLNALARHAYANSPFWRERFDAAGLNPARCEDPDEFAKLPTLTKRELQENRIHMRAAGHRGRLIAEKTGGSTGEPVALDLDEPRRAYRNAVAIRHDRWTGWNIGQKTAYLWGHRQDVAPPRRLLTRLRHRFIGRQLFLDTSSLSVPAMDGFREALLSFKPVIYIGYANAVFLFARFIEARGEPYHRPRAIVTSAELLSQEHRSVIERVFECPVIDRYGSRETGLIASECGHDHAMHIAEESVLVEILRPDDNPAGPGEHGRIVVTDLLNFGMPLIRYEIRDVAEPVDGTCSCGRGLARLKMSGGRITDFLIARDGRIVSGASLTIYLIANARGVAQAQIVQKSRDAIMVKIVPGPHYDRASAEWILGELPRYFDQDMSFSVEEVQEIPLAASGKHRFSICELDPAELF